MQVGRRLAGTSLMRSAAQQDVAGARLLQPRHHADQRALAAARRADDGEEFAFPIDSDVLHGSLGAESRDRRRSSSTGGPSLPLACCSAAALPITPASGAARRRAAWPATCAVHQPPRVRRPRCRCRELVVLRHDVELDRVRNAVVERVELHRLKLLLGELRQHLLLRHLAHRLQVAVRRGDDIGRVGLHHPFEEVEIFGCRFGLSIAELSSIQLMPPLPSAGPLSGEIA